MMWAEEALAAIRGLAPGDVVQLPDDDPRASGYMIGLLLCSAEIAGHALRRMASGIVITAKIVELGEGIRESPTIGEKTRDGILAAIMDCIDALRDVTAGTAIMGAQHGAALDEGR